jgi:hypothetical protein
MAGKIFPINTQAGIQKDGTPYANNFYIDGQHCRFQRGLPQKMGGYVETINAQPFIPRGLYINPTISEGDVAVFSGDQNNLSQYYLDVNGNYLAGVYGNRTPLAFRQDPLNMWTFDVLYSSNNNTNYIFAHAAPNLADINSAVETPVYYGILTQGGFDVPTGNNVVPLVTTNNNVSGGIVALHPYLLYYSNNGIISWSTADDPLTIFDFESVASQKIVTGIQTRAGNAAPGALFWSLDSLIRAYFSPVGNEPGFSFDTISDQTSIMSQNSAIEYDGVYMWCAIDRFCAYTGTVREVPNNMNINYFFNNINIAQRQKVWATKYPKKGEIWWYFPFGNSQECNAAVIYNIRENKWYNTMLSRSCGYYEQIYPFPVWTTNTPDNNNQFSIYTHEKGLDQELFDGTLVPIDSFFETGDIAFCAIGPTGQWTGVNRWVEIEQLEPDFIQSGNMTLTINGREYSNSQVISSAPFTFDNTTVRINPRVQFRHMTLKFDSNVLGGYYEMGQVLLTLQIGDGRS